VALHRFFLERYDGNVLFFVTSDHGRAFEDDETVGDGPRWRIDKHSVHDFNLRVPFLVLPSRLVAQPRRIAGAAGHVDFVPTLLDWLGEARTVQRPGASLLSAIRDGTPIDPSHESYARQWSFGAFNDALVIGDRKYVRHFQGPAGMPSLRRIFDLAEDPREVRSLGDRFGAVALRLREASGDGGFAFESRFEPVPQEVEEPVAHEVENPTSFEIYLEQPSEEPPRYVIEVGDQLEVRFFHMPEQNVLLKVRPDGYVSLPLANEVRAAGRTAEELRLAIVAACQRELRDPEVAVIVQAASAYKVHVGGQVGEPGVIELNGKRTALQAIFEAGGFLPTASPADVVVIRPTGPNKFAVIPIDLERVLDGSDVRQNLTLQPSDAIYVPESPIAHLNRWVDQYIRRNIPVDLGWVLPFGR
jgi:protein involved in polysaccharide export with SLBB domain